jgi:hypothetical protein
MDVQAFSARLASLASRQASKNEVHFCLLVFSSLLCLRAQGGAAGGHKKREAKASLFIMPY